MNNAKSGKSDISNVNSNYRKIIKENSATVKKVMLSFFAIYLFIGFCYDFIIQVFTVNVDTNYNATQGYIECNDCYVSMWDLIVGLLSFKYIPYATISFLLIAFSALLYAKFSYKRVMFHGLNFGLLSREDELYLERGKRKETRVLDDKEKQLINIVEEIKVASLLTFLPEVYIYNDNSPNSFSLANGDKTGFIAVSTGALEILSRDELSAMVAHEFAHMKCEDNKVAYYVDTLSHALEFVLEIISEMAELLLRLGGTASSSSKRDNDSGGSAGAVLLLASLVILIFTWILRFSVPFVTFALRRFLKEGADLRADGLAMKYTRNPIALQTLLNRQHDFNYDKELRDTTRNHSCFFISEEKTWIGKIFFKDKPLLMMQRFNNTLKDVKRYEKQQEKLKKEKEVLEAQTK